MSESLPEYAVKRSEDWPQWLIVTCPREDCGKMFLVQATEWRRNRTYRTFRGKEYEITGRSCPYCMRVACVPRRIPRSRG